MSKRAKQEYSTEFKNRAVNLVIKSEKTTAQIAKDLGINATTLYVWMNKEKSDTKAGKELSHEQLFDELKRVKKELAEVKEQRDILKKATAYFANQKP